MRHSLAATAPVLIVALICLASPAPATADIDSLVYLPPGDVGYVDVQRDAGAKGDGQTDDTAALRSVISAGKYDGKQHPRFGAAREIYFPPGVYVVSDTILIGDKKKMLIGAGPGKTVLRLKDNSPGFQDPGKRKPVLTAVKSYPGWQFAQNFFQRVHDLTIDVGSGNPGAVGLEYHTNNGGDVFGIVVRSSDPQRRGAIGLHLAGGSGPGLIHQVRVEGFDVGISQSGDLHSMALSQIVLQGQRVTGFECRGAVMSVEGIQSENQVPAVKVDGGHLTMINGKFTGGDPKAAAIVHSKAVAFFRNIQTAGYAAALETEGKRIAGSVIDEFGVPKVWSLFAGTGRSLALPVEHPPMPPLPTDPAGWVVVTPNAQDKDDLTAPLQKAIDDGAEYIFVRINKFGFIRDTVHIRNRVRVIAGGPSIYRSQGFKDGNTFDAGPPAKVTERPMTKPKFRIEDGQADVVMLRLLGDSYGDAAWDVEHASKRTAIFWGSGGAYRNSVTGGKAFFVDGGPHPGTIIKGPQQVWAWHCNPESYAYNPNIVNDGGDLWILGIKTEKDRTIIGTLNGGRTELVGGLLFKNRQRLGPEPAFTVQDAQVSLSYKVTRLPYQVHVRETQKGETRELTQQQVGWSMPLYSNVGPQR